VSLVTEGVLMSVANKPAPLSVAERIYYLAQAQTTTTAGVGTTDIATMDSVNVGFFANLTPRILENDKDILLRVSMNISRLVSIETKTVGKTKLEAPRVEYRQLDPEVLIRSGQTLVIAGLSFITNQAEKRGLFGANLWALGGNRDLSNLRKRLVILVTPRVYRPGELPSAMPNVVNAMNAPASKSK